jgi:hypothetical protein
MIATDSLSLVFIACFLFGLLFFIITALLGNLGHGAAHSPGHHTGVHVGNHAAAVHTPVHGHGPVHTPSTHTANTHASTTDGSAGGIQLLFSYINITSVMFFLLGFGFFGYLFHNTGHLMSFLTLLLAGISGVIIAALLLVLLSRLFGNSEGATVQDVSDRTGLLGKVSITIPEHDLGEIIYVSPGGMRKSIAARSLDGRRLERDQEVVVINYARGVAEVDTWDHFINEEEAQFDSSSSDELEKLRTLLDESNQPDTQLVIRKEPQKE